MANGHDYKGNKESKSRKEFLNLNVLCEKKAYTSLYTRLTFNHFETF